jgi:hypothetical protein
MRAEEECAAPVSSRLLSSRSMRAISVVASPCSQPTQPRPVPWKSRTRSRARRERPRHRPGAGRRSGAGPSFFAGGGSSGRRSRFPSCASNASAAAGAVSIVRARPISADVSGSIPVRARFYRAGSTSRRVGSPLAPKIGRVAGSAGFGWCRGGDGTTRPRLWLRLPSAMALLTFLLFRCVLLLAAAPDARASSGSSGNGRSSEAGPLPAGSRRGGKAPSTQHDGLPHPDVRIADTMIVTAGFAPLFAGNFEPCGLVLNPQQGRGRPTIGASASVLGGNGVADAADASELGGRGIATTPRRFRVWRHSESDGRCHDRTGSGMAHERTQSASGHSTQGH